MITPTVKLTQYSHGAGCGCKIAPDVLDKILSGSLAVGGSQQFQQLLVGNHSRDDAAAVDIGDGRAILSTTDFFMPIVDDAFDFGRVAATNAISDIYAMGGKPLMAVAILGWPINILGADIAAQVIAGGRSVCEQAGIALAGGHSIDAPEPIFGLAVTGEVALEHLKRNNSAQAGDALYLTKPLGIGILTTAEKQGKLRVDHQGLATDVMCRSNAIGIEFAKIPGITAMTDVTGFGLAGHLLELCDASALAVTLDFQNIKKLPHTLDYLHQGCIPGGSLRNFEAFGHRLPVVDAQTQHLLCDPQTSGGLLISVAAEAKNVVEQLLTEQQLSAESIGRLHATSGQHSRFTLTSQVW